MIGVYDLVSVLVNDASSKSHKGKRKDIERVRLLKSLCAEAENLYTKLNAFSFGAEVNPDTGAITICIDFPSLRVRGGSEAFVRAAWLSSSVSFAPSEDEDLFGTTVSFTVPGVWRD